MHVSRGYIGEKERHSGLVRRISRTGWVRAIPAEHVHTYIPGDHLRGLSPPPILPPDAVPYSSVSVEYRGERPRNGMFRVDARGRERERMYV